MSTEAEKEYLWGVNRQQHVRLTTLLPSVSGLSRHCDIFKMSQFYSSPWPVMGIASLLQTIYSEKLDGAI
jgi:hypothetical protein